MRKRTNEYRQGKTGVKVLERKFDGQTMVVANVAGVQLALTETDVVDLSDLLNMLVLGYNLQTQAERYKLEGVRSQRKDDGPDLTEKTATNSPEQSAVDLMVDAAWAVGYSPRPGANVQAWQGDDGFYRRKI